MSFERLQLQCVRVDPIGPASQGEVILCEATQRALKFVSGSYRQIIEIGSWLGFSALKLAEWNPNATIVCIDPWLGSFELIQMDGLRRQIGHSYAQFCANTHHLQHRIWPLRMTGVDGMILCHEEGFSPQLIFIDGSHQYEMVWGDIHAARRLFPKATLVLDDLCHPGVAEAVRQLIPTTSVVGNSGIFTP